MSLKMGLFGRKIGMTQVFHDDGTALGVTVVRLGPCVVVAKRTPEIHGYAAVQLGFEETPVRLVTRPEAGYVKKAGIEKTPRFLREVRLNPQDLEKFEIGKVLRASEVFKSGDVIDVVGTTKGKGYQGVMKMHKMKGDSDTHGTHEFFRHGGSIGCRLTPGRVHKGKRMSGRMGGVKCTSCKDGTQSCFTCKGDGIKKGKKCESCNGTGRTACSTCGGDKIMDCGNCGAKGKVLCLQQMVIHEPGVQREDEAWPPGTYEVKK